MAQVVRTTEPRLRAFHFVHHSVWAATSGSKRPPPAGPGAAPTTFVTPSGPSWTASNSSAGPSDSSVGPSDSSAGPNDSSVGPSDSSAGPSDSSVGPSDASVGPNGASAGPNDSSAGASGASRGPSDASSGAAGGVFRTGWCPHFLRRWRGGVECGSIHEVHFRT